MLKMERFISQKYCAIIDGHSMQETPVPIPNTEVKLYTFPVVVSQQRQNWKAVFFFYYRVD